MVNAFSYDLKLVVSDVIAYLMDGVLKFEHNQDPQSAYVQKKCVGSNLH